VPILLKVEDFSDQPFIPSGSSRAIHPEDFIFQYLLKPRAAVTEYFRTGLESVGKLSAVMAETLPYWQTASLLEFASGYGCVSRHVAQIMPRVDMTCCDIHEAAVSFLRDELRVKAELSHRVPEKLELGRQFDAVFALSFFSHMPHATWGRWLKTLVDHTSPNGVVIFTTHGAVSAGHLNVTPIDGYWFGSHSEQEDLDAADYGTAVTTREYVDRQISRIPDAALEIFREAFWWGHQDLYVIRKRLQGAPC
jgi:cyclopropane fatty-acyl-phospholipid synthase-like methyltransferase